MNHTIIKLETNEQIRNLQKHVEKDIAVARAARKLLGDKCFSADAEEKIRILDKLYNCFEFAFTPGDFIQAVENEFSTDSRMSIKANCYIRNHYKKIPV